MTSSPPPTGQSIDERLISLGAQTHSTARLRTLVPWAASIAVHAFFILLGLVVTWTVVRLQAQEEPVLIVADYDAAHFAPVAAPAPLSAAGDPRSRDAATQLDLKSLQQSISQQMTNLDGAAAQLLAGAGAAGDQALASFAPDPAAGTATFIGLRSTNARRIVYVIDASGSMIRSLPIVLEELARSLERLSPQQSFGCIFFQRNEALIAPPQGRLSPANEANRLAALAWIRANVSPSGRSNPLAAIEAALQLKPDVIFMLSENITGSGQFEIDQKDLLALLEKLNPVDQSLGRRRTQINCIQFLDPDPLDTLRKIAAAHGGPSGYKFLSRAELGLGGP